jgi:hypothetical protein
VRLRNLFVDDRSSDDRSSIIVIAFFLSCLLACSGSAQSSKQQSKKVPADRPAKHAATDTVGVVNGDVVTYADFKSIMSGYLKLFVTRSNNNVVSDSLYTIIVDSAWGRAITDILTEQEIGKRHVGMKNSEIEDSLAQSPPDYLRKQFTDSLGKFHAETMRRGLTDPRNDSIATIVLSEERIRLESERLLNSFGPKNASPAAHQKAFDSWLRGTKVKARIIDYRIRFGFY